MFPKCSLDAAENKFDYYRGRYCIEKLCKKLKENAMKIINYKEKEMIPLTDKKISLMKSKKYLVYVKKSFVWTKMMRMKMMMTILKVKDHCHCTGKFRGAAHTICNLRYKVPKNIPVVIQNDSYDTHFIINQLAKEFKVELDCIGENMEKYITFSVPIKKTVKQLHTN